MRDSARAVARLADPRATRTTALLLAIAALSLVPRLWLASHLPLSHNGAWHLFASRNFDREFARIAHPPLFLLLLKACDAVSHSLLAYRLVPLLAGAASVYLVGRVLDRLGCRPASSALGALAAAVSITAVALSCIVEGYTLCVFFVVAAFFFYLDLIGVDRLPPLRSRIAFSAFACLALLSEYVAGLFLVACAAAPLLAAGIDREYRRKLRLALPRRLAADLLTLLPPAAVGLALYALLAKRWATSLSGLPLFYFRPGTETAADFLVRNAGHLVNLFSPFPQVRYGAITLGAFLVFVVAVPVAGRRSEKGAPDRLFPALVLAALLGAGAAAGLLGRYPFGGTPRHQVLLLFFALLAGFVAFDGLLQRAGARGRRAMVLACAAAMAWNAMASRERIRDIGRDEPLNARAGIFEKNLIGTPIVHLDLMNFIGFFMDFHAWNSRYAGRVSDNPLVERYEFSRDGRTITVLAHRWIWVMDFRKPGLYWELRASVGKCGSACDTVFCVYRNLYDRPRTPLPEVDRRQLRVEIPALASAAGLKAGAVRLTDDFVEAEVCAPP